MTTTEPLLERIAAEYREMPGLSLTAAQAARLWGLDRTDCATVLQALVGSGWLTAPGAQCNPGWPQFSAEGVYGRERSSQVPRKLR